MFWGGGVEIFLYGIKNDISGIEQLAQSISGSANCIQQSTNKISSQYWNIFIFFAHVSLFHQIGINLV